jgi:tetratricopeptide (TPR) repeat protein
MTKQRIAYRTGLQVFAGVLCWLLASSPAAAACAVPASMRDRVRAKPTAETYSKLGNWFANKKQFDCAATAFASAAGLDPKSASLAYLWGLSLLSAGHDSKSLAPLQRAVRLDASDLRPHLVLGAALDRLKRTSDAEKEWRTALAIDADSTAALDSLSQDLLAGKDYPGVVGLLDRPGDVRVRSPLQSLNLGIALAAMTRLEDAAAVLREGLNTAPDSLPIADELAVVLMLLSRAEEAYTVFDLALQRHPTDQATQLLYLRALVSSNSDRAAQYARQLLTSHPDHWEVLYLNAVLEAREGKFQPARTHLERSIALHAEYAPAHTALGNALAKLGDMHGAQEQFEKAIRLGDSGPEVQYDLARVLRDAGETERARERLRIYQQVKDAQAARIQAAGKAEMGDQAMGNGDAQRAAGLYREALESDPDEPLLCYKLGKALDKLNDIAGETAALERALRLNPNLAEAQNQMGYLAARGGDSAQADTFFRAATRASPSYVVAWVNLAASLASQARWQDARQALDRALEIDPDNSEARRLGQAIAAAHSDPSHSDP